MLTAFGKFCRKLRIDHGELLKEMAGKLGVTSAFLSAVELGKRNVPLNWVQLLEEGYALNDKSKEELKLAIKQSAKSVKIDLENVPENNRNLALAFAREFKTLNTEEIEAFQKMLREKSK